MYYICKTGRIISDTNIDILKETLGDDIVENFLKDGTIVGMTTDPSVVDLIQHGSSYNAIMRYKDLHNCDVKEAKAMVWRMKHDMEKA